jgi:alpha-L-rhamnosidase
LIVHAAIIPYLFPIVEVLEQVYYAYGSIGGWMYERLAGISMAEPGYKKSRIAPLPIKGITCVEASLETPYGRLACKWKWENCRFTVDIEVPANTTALIRLPGREDEFENGSGAYHYEYETEMELEIYQYSTESTLGEIIDNPLGWKLLEQYMPDFANNPNIQVIRSKSIAELIPQLPQEGAALFDMIINQLAKEEKAAGRARE